MQPVPRHHLPAALLCSALLLALPIGVQSGQDQPGQEPPAAEEPAESREPADLASGLGRGALERGRAVFERTCIECHGDAAHDKAPLIGAEPDWDERLEAGLQTLVRHALEGHGGPDGMPPKGGFSELGNDEVAAAVSYIVHESRGLAPDAARIVAACEERTGSECTPQMARKYLILYLFQGLSGKNR